MAQPLQNFVQNLGTALETEGEEAFFSFLKENGLEPAVVQLCEGPLEPGEALLLACTFSSMGMQEQAEEVLEALVLAALHASSPVPSMTRALAAA